MVSNEVQDQRETLKLNNTISQCCGIKATVFSIFACGNCMSQSLPSSISAPGPSD